MMKTFKLFVPKKFLLATTLSLFLSLGSNVFAQSNCLNFDGSNDYVEINRNISNDFTIEFWINTTQSFNSGAEEAWWNGAGLFDAESMGSVGDFGISMYNGRIFFGTGNPESTLKTSITYNDGKWHHVAVTREMSTGLKIIYIDGVNMAEVSAGTNSLTYSSKIHIGKILSSSNYFNGKIDEVRIWNDVRTENEILQYMHNPLNPATETNLLAYYNFNQGTASGDNTGLTTLTDLKGNNHGTLIGFALNGTSSNWVTGHNNAMFLVFNTTAANQQITLPLLYSTVDVSVDWGDGSAIENVTSAGDITHNYTNIGTYHVTIDGSLSRFGNGWTGHSNSERLIKVFSFGDLDLTNLSGAFSGSSNLTEVPAFLPIGIDDLSYTFNGAASFNQDISTWNVSSVTNMTRMFQNASTFNQNIGNWDLSSCLSINSMFCADYAFNQDISNWDIRNVADMDYLFCHPISTAYYTAMLIKWSQLPVQSDVPLRLEGSKYFPVAQSAHDYLTGTKGWIITDEGVQLNNALSFDGVDDYVNLGAEANFGIDWNTPFSIETWIKTTEPADHAIIASLDATTYKGWIIDLTVDGNLRLILSNSISTNVLGCYSTGTIDDGNWHHCVVTYDGSGNANNVKFYIDGYASSTVVDANTLSASIATSGNVFLGNRVNTPNYCIDATIDEIRIWNVVRTHTEICENMSKPIENPAIETNLVAYYDFDQTSGTVLPDLAGGDNNGTLQNFPAWVTSNSLQVPTIITSPYDHFSNNNIIPVEINFYTEVTGFLQSDIIFTNGNISDFTDLGNGKYGFNVTAIDFGTVQISIPAGACTTVNLGQPNLAGTLNVEYFIPQGNALNFDGINDVVEIPHNDSFNSLPLTVEGWIKSDGAASQDAIINKYLVSSHNGWTVAVDNNAIIAGYFRDASNYVNAWVTSTTNVNDGNWHHFAFVVDNSGGSLYVDGILETTEPWIGTAGAPTSTTNINLGYYQGHTEYYSGDVDEIRIWNVVRSQSEIQANMYNYIDISALPVAGLLAYYRFDQGNTGTAKPVSLQQELIDYSGNCNKGTLTNFALTGETSNWVHPGNPEVPILSTEEPASITSSSAIFNATIFSTGEDDVVERGFCFSTFDCPTINDYTTDETGNFGAGSYSLQTNGLMPSTVYFVRAYATNAKGTNYGETMEFSTLPDFNQNLVAYFPFNNNADDLSGNANHGTASNVVYSENRFGKLNSAAFFEPYIGAQIVVPDADILDFTEEYTIVAWVKPDASFGSGETSRFPIVVKRIPFSVNDSYGLYINSEGYIYSNTYDGATTSGFTGTIQLIPDTWNQVAVTRDIDGKLIIYVNGTEDGYLENTVEPQVIDVDLTIGACDNFNYHGHIDEVRLYDRALGITEIQNLYVLKDIADAGQDQTICTNTTTLNAVSLTEYYGTWNTTDIGFGNFYDATLPSTSVSNLSPGENRFEWVVDVEGTAYRDTVSIFNYQIISTAGVDTSFTATTTPLSSEVFFLNASDLSAGETGIWTCSQAGVQISAPQSPGTAITNLTAGNLVFTWTVTNSFCMATDDVSVLARTHIENNPSVIDGEWTLSSTWLPSVVPGEYDTVTVKNGSVRINGTIGVFGSLRIASGGDLTIIGTLAKGPGTLTGSELIIEQDVDKQERAPAYLNVGNGGNLIIEQDVDKSSKVLISGGISVGSGGNLIIEQDVDKAGENPQVILRPGIDLTVCCTRPEFSVSQAFVNVGNGGNIIIEQDVDKKDKNRSTGRINVGSGGNLIIEQDVDKFVGGVVINGGDLIIEQDVDKQLNDKGVVRISGGQMQINQNTITAELGKIVVGTGGELIIEQDVDKLGIPSSLISPQLFVRGGQVLLGDTLGQSISTCKLNTGNLIIEQDVDKLSGTVNMIIGSGGTADFVEIPGITGTSFMTIGDNASVSMLYDAALAVPEGNALDVVVVEEGGSLVVEGTNVVIPDLIDVEKYIHASGQTASVPVAGMDLSSLTGTEAYVYGESTGAYTSLTAPYAFNPTEGYYFIPAVADTFVFTGEVVTGTKTVALYNSAGDLNASGWNLIGNPFTAALDFEETETGQIENTLYIYNPNGDNFQTYQKGGISLNGGNRIISPTEAFFLKTTIDNQNLNLGLGKFHNIDGLRKLRPVEPQKGQYMVLSVSGEGKSDQTYIELDNTAQRTFESNIDAFKPTLGGIRFYTVADGGEYLAINKMNVEIMAKDTLALNFESSVSGNFVISSINTIAQTGLNIYLHDKTTNITRNINALPYEFAYTTGEATNRFEIIFDYTFTGNDNNVRSEDVTIYSHKQDVVIRSQSATPLSVTIYGTSGIPIKTAQLPAWGETRLNMNCSEGIYFVKVSGNGILKTQKIVLVK